MYSLILFMIASLSTVTADYQCLCNYNVELKIYEKPSTTSSVVDYMYEFDCKQYLPMPSVTEPWMAIAFTHHVRYVSGNTAVQIQMCQGSPPLEDRVTTTPQPATTTTITTSTSPPSTLPPSTPVPTAVQSTTIRPITTTIKPNTTIIKTATTTTKPTTTTTKPTTTTTKPTTTTTKPTTTTTQPTTTTTKPSTTTTKPTTTTTKPTTTTTKPTLTTTKPTTTTTKPTLTTTQPTTSTTIPTTTTTKPTTTFTKSTSTTMKPTTRQPTTITSTTTIKPTTTVTTTAQTSTPTTHSTFDPCASVQARHSSQLNGKLSRYWNICYEFVTKSVSWISAETDCRSKGGNLAHIQSIGEQTFIYQYLKAHLNHRVWIGLNDHRNEEKFEWSSGDPLNFTHWSPDRYTVIHRLEDCVDLDPTNYGYWNDKDCDTAFQAHYGYICQYGMPVLHNVFSTGAATTNTTTKPTTSTTIPTTTTMKPTTRQPTTVTTTTTIKPTTTVTTTAQTSTPTTHSTFDPCASVQARHSSQLNGKLSRYWNICYEFVTKSVSWISAETDCRSKGGNLAHIQSIGEQTFIYQYLKSHLNHRVWIGLNDHRNEEKFEWSSGDPLNFTHWSPDRYTVIHMLEDCVDLDPTNYGYWNDKDCDTAFQAHYGYVCQYDMLVLHNVFSTGAATTNTTTKPTTSTTIPTTTTIKPTSTTTRLTTTFTKSTSTTMKPTTRQPTTVTSTTTIKPRTTVTTTAQTSTPTTHSTFDPCASVQARHSSQLNGKLSRYWNICYEFVTKSVSWISAETDCRSKGGNLAHIQSIGEQTFIYQYLKAHLNHRVWIGLNDHRNEEKFEWSSGDPLNFTHWSPDRYTVIHRLEDCVELDPTNYGYWNDKDCDTAFQTHDGYICQYDNSVSVPTTHITNGLQFLTTTYQPQSFHYGKDGNTRLCSSKQIQHSLDDGTILGEYSGNCYELMTKQRMTWLHAERLCNSGGGHLVDINSAAEQTFIQDFVNRHMPREAVWIGLHDRSAEGIYLWTTGKGFFYKNFVSHHLHNFASRYVENCFVLLPFKNGQWDDIPCGENDAFYNDYGETHPVLCQFPTVATPLIG